MLRFTKQPHVIPSAVEGHGAILESLAKLPNAQEVKGSENAERSSSGSGTGEVRTALVATAQLSSVYRVTGVRSDIHRSTGIGVHVYVYVLVGVCQSRRTGKEEC